MLKPVAVALKTPYSVPSSTLMEESIVYFTNQFCHHVNNNHL